MTNRTLIIGLDGASIHLVRKWQSELPHLSKLMQGGVSGKLTSILPPRSIPAWYCFATGMNPAKLGVFGFSQRLPGTYDYTFANLTYCRAPTFWQWLNQHGLKTAVVHVPGTFPPHPVKGALVSGWPAPGNRGNLTYTHPPELSRTIDANLGQPLEFLSKLPMRLDNDAAMLRERQRIIKLHGDVAMQVLESVEWDAGLVVLSPLDRASHQFWRHTDPDHPAYNAAEATQFSDALKQVYCASDEQVGRFLTLTNAQDTVFIVSDHGFGPAYRTFYINEWLKQEGYLILKESSSAQSIGWKTRIMGALTAPLFKLNDISPTFRRLTAPFKKRTLSNIIRDEYVRAQKGGLVRLNHLPVDWSRTRAYCHDEGSLHLNLQGRDPEGCVRPGTEAENLLQEIISKLQNLTDPRTGQPVQVQFYRKEDIYSGPFLEQAPELLVVLDDYTTEVMAELGSRNLFEANEARNGTHNMDGLLIARGPTIVSGQELNANLMDIAPTTIHLCGAPVPEESDGKVLLQLFEETAEIRQRSIRWTSSGIADITSDGEMLSVEEQDQVEQQLRDLGYLS